MSVPGKNSKLPTSRAKCAERIKRAYGRALDQVWWVGRELLDAKEALKHGEFEAMIEQDLPFKPRTARKFMAIASDKRLDDLKRSSGAVLPASYTTLAALVSLDDETFKAAIEDGRINADMTRQDAEKIQKEARRRDRLTNIERIASALPPSLLQLPDLRGPEVEITGPHGEALPGDFNDSAESDDAGKSRAPLSSGAAPARRYAVIYADPPWQFESWDNGASSDRGPAKHYPTMTVEEIAALPVGEIAGDHAVLFLWVTSGALGEALVKVLPAWGFTYKSNAVWPKSVRGTGYWFRNKHEQLLLATKGSPPAPVAGQQWDSTLDGPPLEPGRHSSKPASAREMIESYFPSTRRLELFARAPEDGAATRGDDFWDFWGNQSQPTCGSGEKFDVGGGTVVDVEADDVSEADASEVVTAADRLFEVEMRLVHEGEKLPRAHPLRPDISAWIKGACTLQTALKNDPADADGLAKIASGDDLLQRLGEALAEEAAEPAPAPEPEADTEGKTVPARATLQARFDDIESRLALADMQIPMEHPLHREASAWLSEAHAAWRMARGDEASESLNEGLAALNDTGEDLLKRLIAAQPQTGASDPEPVEEEEDLLEIPDFLRRT